MTALTMTRNYGPWLPPGISTHLIHITNLQLYYVSFFSLYLKLDQITSLISLRLYRCLDSSSILSNFKNPKLKHFHMESEWHDYDYDSESEEDYGWVMDEDFEGQFSFIRSFQGLETLAIEVPDQRHPAGLLKNLVESISLDHNDTLRHLALFDACMLKDCSRYKYGTTESRNSVYAAVMACPHLIQLELPTEWRTKELDFKVCLFCIYNL